MNKSEEEILNNLNQKADQFEMPVDDFVWDAILSEVQPEKTKRRFVFWWIFVTAAVLFATALTFGWYATHDENDLAQSNEVALTGPSVSKEKLSRSTRGLIADSSHNFVLDEPTTLGPSNSNTEVLEDILDVDSLQNANVARNGLRKRENFSKVELVTSQISKNNLETAPIGKVKDNVDDADSDGISSIGIINTNPLTNSQFDSLKVKIDDPLNLISGTLEKGNSIEDKVSTNSQFDSLNLSTDDPLIFNSDTLEKSGSRIDSAENNDEQPPNMIPTKVEENERKFTLLLHGGVGESFRSLSSGTHHDLIQHKNDHESFGGCFEIGLDAQFTLGIRFIARTGVGYKFYSDKYDFQHDLITHTTRNDYQYFQVPLIFGYNLMPRPKSNFYLLGGLKANLLTSAQSSWIDVSALVPVAHNNASVNTPFRSITGAISLGLDYNYQISEHISLHAMPSIDAFLNSVYKRKTDLNQRPFSFNIDLGVSYSF
ncbi:MAG: hypothetical protein ACI8ZM_002543 [Crocinitomix sp.]|jgi:hypothetical protein